MLHHCCSSISLVLMLLVVESCGFSTAPETSKFMKRHEELQLKFQQYNQKLIQYEQGLQEQLQQMDHGKRQHMQLHPREEGEEETAAPPVKVIHEESVLPESVLPESVLSIDNPSVKLLQEEIKATIVDEADMVEERLTPAPPPLSSIKKSDLANKYFQLDEQEDDFHCKTEVLLRHDGYVDVGQTDGPKIKETSGTWQWDDAISSRDAPTITITLHRQFGSGGGDLAFYVARTFTGTLVHLSKNHVHNSRLGVAGTAHELDSVLGNPKVGHFQMMDVSHLKDNGKQFRIPPKVGVDSFAFWRTKLVSIH